MMQIWLDACKEDLPVIQEVLKDTTEIIGCSYPGMDNACDVIRDGIAERQIIFVSAGPLSNAASVLKRYPSSAANIRKIIFQGGCLMYGNVHGYAEKNLYADPQAAEYILTHDLAVMICPLEVSSAYAPFTALKMILEGDMPAGVKVCGAHAEIRGQVSMGKLVTDLWSDAKFPLRKTEILVRE